MDHLSPPGPGDIICGIDLGTSNSCIAFYHNNSAETIEDPTGSYTVPSIVSFTPHERHVGKAAAPQRDTNALNLLYGIKRLIGHDFNDPNVQKDLQHWPFRVEADPNTGKPLLVVDYLGKERRFFPEEISAMVLAHIKDYASTRIGQDVKHCVITCPAYFNDLQRNATKNAGTIAGWNVMRVVNEPTAAAFDYAYNELSRDPNYDKTILIFDLGGGTFDVSVLRLYQGQVQTLATGGDDHFGGEDFDLILTQYLLDIVNAAAQSQGDTNPDGTTFDLRHKPNKFARLRMEAIRAKEALGSCERTTINLQDIHSAAENVDLTRAKMDLLCRELYDKILPPITQVLADAGLTKENVDDVVLVGGSSRIQRVKELIKDYFPEGKVKTLVANPDQAIARGAAIVAASFSSNPLQVVQGINIRDITSHSIGVLKAGRKVQQILKKHTPYPTQIVYPVTKREGAETLAVTLYEGEAAGIVGNQKLGVLRLDGLDPEADEHDYEVHLAVDESSAITATLYDPATQKVQSTTFVGGNLSDEDIIAKRQSFLEFEKESEEYKKWTIHRAEVIERVSTPYDILIDLDQSTVEEQYQAQLETFKELVERFKECEHLGPEYAEYFGQLEEHLPQYDDLINYLSSMESFDFDF